MSKSGSFFYNEKSKDKEISKKRWNVFTIIGKVIQRTCTALGALVLFSIILSTVLVFTMSGDGAKPLPDDMVLVFKIEEGITETHSKPTFLEPFPYNQPTLRNVIDTLDKAKNDPRVRGLVFSLKGGGVTLSHAQELRAAVARFQESGKFTKIYAPTYASGAGGLTHYYLASVFDEIWMQPVGMVSVTGIDAKMPYAKNTLDKIGVSGQFLQREEYKGAMETFTQSEMPEPSRKMYYSVFKNMATQMVDGISLDREIDAQEMNALVDKGLLTGTEALDAKLVDRLDYPDVMLSEIRQTVAGNPEDESVELVTLGRYSHGKAKPANNKNKDTALKKKSKVALIYVTGTIMDVSGAQGNAGADDIAATITKAYSDKDISAIVVRVDSPGGSPTASETIRRALVKAQEKDKKVIVSMGPVAASGGYWISTHADKIFATPATLTGSIGVVMGKFEASDLWNKIGLNWEGPQIGKNAGIWSINQPFTEDELARMNVLIDNTYEAFLTRVAEGRGLSESQVRRIARGRVWTGEQARNVGLVDELGGLDQTLDFTAKMLGKGDRHDINVVKMPRELSGIERFLELIGQEVSIGAALKNATGIDPVFLKSLKGVANQAALSQQSPAMVYDAQLETSR